VTAKSWIKKYVFSKLMSIALWLMLAVLVHIFQVHQSASGYSPVVSFWRSTYNSSCENFFDCLIAVLRNFPELIWISTQWTCGLLCNLYYILAGFHNQKHLNRHLSNWFKRLIQQPVATVNLTNSHRDYINLLVHSIAQQLFKGLWSSSGPAEFGSVYRGQLMCL
jgi:hypothetical protein